MPKSSRIPLAPSVLWESIRLRVLPLLIFSAVVAIIALQWDKLDGGGVAGIAEGVRSGVTCPQLAILQEVTVEPYQIVAAGQPIATIRPIDPRARLDLLQSELQLARLRLDPSLPEQNAMDFERLRVEALRLKLELAEVQVDLQQAETALRRNTQLREAKLISEEVYELSLRDRDKNLAGVTETRKALVEVEGRLVALRPLGYPSSAGSQPRFAAITDLEAKMAGAAKNWEPIELLAPISGMVQIVNRRPGEFVAEGEPLVTIASPRADRIIAYLRQPYFVEPELGMKVEVVTRSYKRRKFSAEVAQIGAQVEVITNALAVLRPWSTLDAGLPVVLTLPPQANVRPGEAFDVRFLPNAADNRQPRYPGNPNPIASGRL